MVDGSTPMSIWMLIGFSRLSKGREKEMDVLGGLTVGEESGVQTCSRYPVYTYGTIKEIQKCFCKVMFLPQMSLNKRLNPVPWDSL